MINYYGGQAVKEGFYLKCSTLECESIARGGSILAGNGETRYIRVPLPIAMMAGPWMGLAYVIFLPILVCFAFVYSLTRRVGRSLKTAGRQLPRR